MDDQQYETAKKRVEDLKGFYIHLTVYVVIMTFLAIVNLFTTPNFWWFLFIAFFWGIGLVSNALSVFSRRGFFSKEWEERKIRKYMEEEEKK